MIKINNNLILKLSTLEEKTNLDIILNNILLKYNSIENFKKSNDEYLIQDLKEGIENLNEVIIFISNTFKSNLEIN